MPRLLLINSAITGDASVSRTVADNFVSEWRLSHPAGEVIVRDLARDPLPELTMTAYSVKRAPADSYSPEQTSAAALIATLIDEVQSADTVVITAPMYNYFIPASLKTWIDHICIDPRAGAHGTIFEGKPTFAVSARGGSYRPGTPREGWDFAEPYLEQVLGTVFGMNLTIITPELTLAHVVPAMSELIPLAEASLENSLALAASGARTA